MPRRFRVALVIEGLVAIALLIDLVARIPAHRRQGDLAVHLIGVLVCLAVVAGIIVWTERLAARPPKPKRDPTFPLSPDHVPGMERQPAEYASDLGSSGRPALGGLYTVKGGVWTSHVIGSKDASFDWSLGRKEPGSRWGRIVSWTDPATGTQFYTLGAKYFGPTGYMVTGLIAFGVGVFVAAIPFVVDPDDGKQNGIGTTLTVLAVSLIPFLMAYLSFMCGFNLRRYDRKHHYRFLYEGDVRRLRRQLEAGEPFDKALLRARLIGTVWAWITLVLVLAYVLYRQATGW